MDNLLHMKWTPLVLVLCCVMAISCREHETQEVDLPRFEQLCRESGYVMPKDAKVVSVDKSSRTFVIHSDVRLVIPAKFENASPASENTILACLQPMAPTHRFGTPVKGSALFSNKNLDEHSAIDFMVLQTSNGWYLQCSLIGPGR